ncbi:hypothetical protein E3N88_08989 [Mikania micrantha]|uniref:Integrase catalytic domain-containing protein n=1 Tax=Mikania micrantha TaxID=192012 RepID=A0A5N6PK40_9ASTR|nr:hypothetical protein E3N88_08989 [Mikania micrantha]
MKDIHEEDCGNHTGGRAFFSKILRTGYFWPTMRRDAMSYSQKCDACQRHSNIIHQPAEPLHPIVSSWPFMKCGMDIVGKLPKAPGGKVFMLAMTDYFSKWIEAEAFVKVREKEFIGKRTTNFCESWGIKMITSSPVHPQANGQAESSNKIIINNLKKKLGSKKGNWAEELPFVLWTDRTTTKNATGQTPFSLVYGSEVVLPTEMVVPTARSSLLNLESNKEIFSEDLDTIDELRDIARIIIATYQQKIAKSYNKNIRIRRFQVGDLVLRKAFLNTTNPADGKLAPKRRDETLCLNPSSDLKSELDEDPALTLCLAAKTNFQGSLGISQNTWGYSGITVWKALRGQQSAPQSPDYEEHPLASIERPVGSFYNSPGYKEHPLASIERPVGPFYNSR